MAAPINTAGAAFAADNCSLLVASGDGGIKAISHYLGFLTMIPTLLRYIAGVVFASAAAMTFAAEPPAQSFELTISGGSVAKEQRLLRVDKGTPVKLRISSDAAGSLHLHAYKLEVRVVPGTPADLAFTARATGRFRFEWHPDNAKSKSGDHHGPPLATLEVRPR